jgi:exopolyphosphatase / guanosine-5'-triphosphate,3'-diphosphate pyrophosphatase
LKFAAIDIGSNGARMQISSVLHDEGISRFKKVEYVRFPLRLGHDVFTQGRITPQSEDRMMKLMLAYQLLMELHEVDDFMACSTSAMREAANGQEVRDHIENRTGIHIQIIDGQKEAELVNNVVVQSLGDGQYIHIDVGGGSTELNLYQDRQKIKAKSFKLGSVRLLEGKESKNAWLKIKEWINQNVDYSSITASLFKRWAQAVISTSSSIFLPSSPKAPPASKKSSGCAIISISSPSPTALTNYNSTPTAQM